ncbi:tRNA lysidine(34) synthetase TilS [Rheinheimera sp.]|uniref:tRNA lysidine(34) synthetase TilS n=1 Tax=Rheinheimera sp. TaxID=1869214 RepID=UPI00307F9DC6
MTSKLLQALMASLKPLAPQKLVLALSGGLDSMVLLELCVRLRRAHQFELEAVYIHHGLSQYANDWATFCAEQCLLRAVPFQSVRVKLDGGANLEAKARQARYDALAAFVQQSDTVLLTAHHADDQLESMLLALKRGAGLAGLAGIAAVQPFAQGHMLRPLLAFSRAELEDFAAAEQLDFVEDDSNSNSRFDRNFLRNEVIPLLQQRWPSFRSNALRSQQHVRELWHWQQQQIEPVLSQVQQGQRLNLQELAQFPLIEQQLLVRHWLAQWQLNPSSGWLSTFFTELVQARQDAQPLLQLEQYQLRRFQQWVYLLEPQFAPEAQSLVWDGSLLHLPHELGSVQLTTEGEGTALLYDTSLPLQLCFGQYHWPFLPAGARHHKTLKQWLKLWQIPPWQRAQLPVLVQAGQVLAVAGITGNCADDQAKARLLWQHGPDIQRLDQA